MTMTMINNNNKYSTVTNGIFTLMYNNDNGKFNALFQGLSCMDLDNLFSSKYGQCFLSVTNDFYEQYVVSIYNTYYNLWLQFSQNLYSQNWKGRTVVKQGNENANNTKTNSNILVNDMQRTENEQTNENSFSNQNETITETDNNLLREFQTFNDMQTYDVVRDKFAGLLFLKVF